jgi:hypothetical protein
MSLSYWPINARKRPLESFKTKKSTFIAPLMHMPPLNKFNIEINLNLLIRIFDLIAKGFRIKPRFSPTPSKRRMASGEKK